MPIKEKKQIILLVDDTFQVIKILRDTLHPEYGVIFATRGAEALLSAASKLPDLILLDIMMPEMDGFEVCERLKKEVATKDIPVIFVTAKSEVADETKGLTLGAVDFITKPISPPVVKARVKMHLELKQQERAIKALHHENKLLLEAVGEGIYGVDLEGKTTFINSAAAKMTGWTVEELTHKSPHEIFHHSRADGSHYPTEECPIYAAIHDDKAHFSDNEVFWRKDGTSFTVEYTSTPLKEDHKIKGAVVVFRDITERRRMEETVRQAMANAKAATVAKSDFLANMSHEIRTPMNGVLGMIDLALATEMSAKTRDYLAHAKTSSQILLRIINDILDFSKIEAGKLNIEPVHFYLGDLLGESVNLFKNMATDKDIEMVVRAPPQSLGMLFGDQMRLQQVLVNLVGNAVKFTEKGEIVVKVLPLEKNGEHIRLEFSIKDTGIGLTQEQISRLFSAFEQADSSTTRQYGGTGLGLTICKRLVELMGGKIWVESQPKKGSTFHFTALLGCKTEDQHEVSQVPEDLLRLNILVVDDNATARIVTEEVLLFLGLVPKVVKSGEEALADIDASIEKGFFYPIVLLDWRMPGMDGMEVARKIIDKEIKTPEGHFPFPAPFPKIIMMTAFGQEEVLQQAKQIGIDAFLVKPMTPSLLLDVILDVLGKTIHKRDNTQEGAVDEVGLIQKLAGAKVLLTEDNVINQRVAQEILANVGIVVTVANNGQEAVDLIIQTDFDLVLMDIQMPVMDGYKAARTLRQNPHCQDLPIIAMTAHALTGDRAHCLAAGMNDYVSKPINTKQLYATLETWIQPRENAAAVRATLEKKEPIVEDNKGDKALGELLGIDVKSALRRLGGNVALFKEMWGDFGQNYGKAVEEIETALSRDTEREDVLRLIHSIKGVAGNLGARDLQKATQMLEKSVTENQREAWPTLLSSFSVALGQVLASTKPLLLERQAADAFEVRDNGEDALSDTVDLAPLLNQLASHIRNCDGRSGECLALLWKQLRGTGVHGEMKNLERDLDGFAFEQASARLKTIAEALQTPLDPS